VERDAWIEAVNEVVKSASDVKVVDAAVTNV